MRRRPLFLVLALSLALNLVPFWWGMPAYWAVDELRPFAVLRGLARHFSGGWASTYPPLHYYLLSILYWPVRVVESAGLTGLAPVGLATLLLAVGRLFSVVLATSTVYLVYRCGRLLHDRSTAVMAALVAALVAPFVFYAKTINLEAPYLFWFALALFFFLRILRRHRLRDYLLFATAATFSVCTKDQAVGLYVLSPLMLLAALYSHRRREDPGVRLARVLFDRRLLLSGLLAVVLFALIHNLAFNYEGFERHVEIIVRRSPTNLFDRFESTPAGHLAMAAESLRHLGFALSAPLLLVSLVGVARALRKPRLNAHFLAVLLFGVSYYAFFVSVAQHNRVRSMLPICLILSFFAAKGLIDLVRWKRLSRTVAVSVVSALLLFCGLRALSVDLAMLADSRYRVEAWLDDNMEEGETVIAVGRQNMLPRDVRTVGWGRVMRRGRPAADFVVVNMVNLRHHRGRRAFFEALSSGELGYELVWQHRGEPFLDLLDTEGIFTNLDRLNPEIAVFRRRNAGGVR